MVVFVQAMAEILDSSASVATRRRGIFIPKNDQNNLNIIQFFKNKSNITH